MLSYVKVQSLASRIFFKRKRFSLNNKKELFYFDRFKQRDIDEFIN